jgi:Bifunctional DNA primase/polymerase, N-terminal
LRSFRAGATRSHSLNPGTISSTNPATISKWWTRNPHALPAIALGKVDLFVLDGDRHGGPDGCKALFDLLRNADIGDAPIVETPNNGVHIYFKQNGHNLGNTEGSLPDGINARGSRGYTIAPYTNLPDGRCYHAAEGTPDFIAAFTNGLVPNVPQAVVDLIKREDEPHTNSFTFTRDTSTRQRAYASAALKGCTDTLAATVPGRRNETLNAVAYRMGRMVARHRWLRWAAQKTSRPSQAGRLLP